MLSKIKRNFNEYKSMPGGNPYDRPILMKDGKVIDQDATVIEDGVIAENMRYIAKMAKGLATGVLSQDEEYIELQNKVMDELILKKSSETRTKIEKEAKQKVRDYADAHRCHQKALDRIQAQSAQIAKDNTTKFYVDNENQVYKLADSTPIGLSPATGGKWRRIDLKELKKNHAAREKAAAELRKKKGPQSTHEKIDDALDKFNKKKTKKKATKKKTKKKVVEKRTPKKRNTKKKTVKAKKRDKR